MWNSIIFKEWLKIKWFVLGLNLIGVLAISYVFLSLRHDMEFYAPNKYWFSILFMGNVFYNLIKFIPLIMGLIIGVSQFFPEIVDKRIKLSFHLPLNENSLLLKMMAFGALALIASYTIFYGFLLLSSSYYFPYEIIKMVAYTTIPWFIAGLSIYFWTALLVFEPIWKYKVAYGIIGYFFINIFFVSCDQITIKPILFNLIGLTVISSIALLFSAFRFRKGEM